MSFKEFAIRMLCAYGSTTIVSLISNRIYYINKLKNGYENSKRRLVYRDLAMVNGKDLSSLYRFYKIEKMFSRIKSLIPFYQMYFSIYNIYLDKEEINEFFNKKIDAINTKEIEERKRRLEEIKKALIIPEEIKEKLKDEEYLPDEADYFEIKVLNLKNSKNEKEH